MTKEEYRALLKKEVFGNKKLSFWQMRHKLRYNASADAVYLVRTLQYHSSFSSRWHKHLAARAKITLIHRYNIFVGEKTVIGEGLMFPHPTGIILGQAVEIGRNCKIFQGVTVGSRRNGDYKQKKQPHIGDDVTLFSGCGVIGAITVGDRVQIGANAVMNRDAPADTVWAGVPARQISPKPAAEAAGKVD